MDFLGALGLLDFVFEDSLHRLDELVAGFLSLGSLGDYLPVLPTELPQIVFEVAGGEHQPGVVRLGDVPHRGELRYSGREVPAFFGLVGPGHPFPGNDHRGLGPRP